MKRDPITPKAKPQSRTPSLQGKTVAIVGSAFESHYLAMAIEQEGGGKVVYPADGIMEGLTPQAALKAADAVKSGSKPDLIIVNLPRMNYLTGQIDGPDPAIQFGNSVKELGVPVLVLDVSSPNEVDKVALKKAGLTFKSAMDQDATPLSLLPYLGQLASASGVNSPKMG